MGVGTNDCRLRRSLFAVVPGWELRHDRGPNREHLCKLLKLNKLAIHLAADQFHFGTREGNTRMGILCSGFDHLIYFQSLAIVVLVWHETCIRKGQFPSPETQTGKSEGTEEAGNQERSRKGRN